MTTLPIVSTFRTSGKEALLFTKHPELKKAPHPHIIIDEELRLVGLNGFTHMPTVQSSIGMASLAIVEQDNGTLLQLTFENVALPLAEVRGTITTPLLEAWVKEVNAKLSQPVTFSSY